MHDESLSAIEASICALLRAELGDPGATLAPETRVADLGVSSIKILRVVAKLEKQYEIELDDDVIFDTETLRDLATVIAAGCSARGQLAP
jgi:acyl carrier protein